MQAALLKELPNKMLVATGLCVFSAVQSFIVAVAAERDFSRWQLRLDVSLLAVVYAVIIIVLSHSLYAASSCFLGTHFNSYSTSILFLATPPRQHAIPCRFNSAKAFVCWVKNY